MAAETDLSESSAHSDYAATTHDGTPWRISFAVILALHVGPLAAALILGARTTPDMGAPPAAFLIDMTPSSPRINQGAPPSTAQNDSLEEVEVETDPEPEQEPETAPEPPIEPTPLIEETAEQTESEDQEPVQSEPEPAEASAAAPAQASTGFEAPPSPIAAAPEIGAAEEVRHNAVRNWQSDVLAHLAHRKRYPRAARRAEEEGVAVINLTMNRNGYVIDYALVESSGSATLDAEATSLIERAQPFPPPPPEVEGDTITLVVPIDFSLR